MARGAYAQRIDNNQHEIVKVYRKLGISVLILSSVGKGCPDILIGITDIHGIKHNILIEIKDGEKSPSQKKLTVHEQKFFDKWQGNAFIVTTIDEALDIYYHYKDGNSNKLYTSCA